MYIILRMDFFYWNIEKKITSLRFNLSKTFIYGTLFNLNFVSKNGLICVSFYISLENYIRFLFKFLT